MFTNDFRNNDYNKSNGNSFNEIIKTTTHLGFGTDGNY